MNIGIEPHSNLVYEGASLWGQALLPRPFLIAATIASSADERVQPTAVENLGCNMLLFREDTFDAVTRVRRGRFYKSGNTQPQLWQLHPHPLMPGELKQVSKYGVLQKSLATFFEHRISHEIARPGTEQTLVVLGNKVRYAVWSLVGIETTVTGEELATLRSRQSIGVLPRIWPEAIPEIGREAVLLAVSKLAEEIYRAGPESVIDSAREAATAILSAYLRDCADIGPGLDLGNLAKELDRLPDERRRRIAFHSAETIRLFHPRRKNAEQEKRPFRSIREQDGELAVQCLATILCELGWAEWT